MSDIDHKTIATVTLFADRQYRDVRSLAEAQVHATLYLAEQQRIANVIAYWAAMTEEKLCYLNDDDKARFRGVQESIEKALGIA